MRCLLLTMVLLFIALSSLFGAYLSFQPINAVQPDGTKLELFATGDEFYNWLHDKKGYTIKQNDKGWYVYLDKDAKDELVFTELIVGINNPENNNIKPSTNISPEKMAAKRSARQKELRDIGVQNARTTGTLNNIVIFIRFSDQTEFGQNLSTYSSMFNGTTGNNMQTYFAEASYNTLNITTTFYPTPTTTVVSWQDSHARAYFSPYNATTNPIGYQNDTQRTDREHILLKNAVDGVSSMIPSGLNVDADGDTYVDNVCFIIKGTSDGWAELLWPHMWALYTQTAYINGKRVWTFNFQLSDFMASSGNGVLSHEMFHSLGAPDLYHYYENVFTPVGSWDLMEQNANPPQHMGAYMKWKYGGWIASIPTISTDGTYYLNPLVSSTNNAYRINSPNSSTEYFVVEYRQKTGTFESSIPATGMLVYRINTAYDGNADGPPDEVYIYRPNGTTTVNGSISSANYSLATGRTAINSTTNPTPFLTSGAAGGLNINTIGAAGSTISFVLGNPAPPNITWNPASFSQTLPANQTANQTLTIGNTVSASLTYTASLPTGAITVLDETFATTSRPTNWTEALVSGTALSWVYASGGTSGQPAAAYDGAYNARLYKASSTASVVKLITPQLDLSGAISASLTFWHTQAYWSGDQDELRIYYKTSLGGAWNILATYTASIAAWTMETISLPNPNATYYIAFEGTAKYGYGVCLDKVVVTKQSAPPVPWLTLNSGTSVSNIISGIGNNNITIGFSTAGMSAGTYNTTITVTSNSAVNSTVQIPVTLNVTVPAPAIIVNPTSLAYGSVKVGTTTNNTFTISNTGSATLTGSITTPTGYNVVLAARATDESSERNIEIITKSSNDRNVLPYSVLGNSSSNFTLTFAPLAVQNYNGNVVITSNDPLHPSVNVAVTGAGFIPPTIGLNKTNLTLSLAIHAENTDNFTISNSGSQTLTYSIVESPAVAWFSAAPLSGNISASGSNLITGSFSADGMTPGAYQTTLLINSNDPANPQKTVTINLEVTNTAPIIDLPASFALDMNGTLVVDCSPYVDDPDGQVLAANYTGNTHINVSIDVPFVTFTAAQDWYGTENITFSVYDGYVYSYDTVAVTVNLTQLAVPEISTIALSSGNLMLNWSPVTNALQYKIYRALEPGGTYIYLTTTDQTFYQDTQVLDKAFYHVIAVNNPPAK